MNNNRQLFFSHTWQKDNLNRNNHKRVYELAKKLEKCGWTIWIDEELMIGNIDAAMATGIDNAEAIIVCLTENYCLKVNETAKNPHKRDNCLKEWTYANMRNKLMIPVVMEPKLLSMNNWPPGVVSLYFGSTLYINGTNNLNTTVIVINKLLEQYRLHPKNRNINLTNNITASQSNIMEILKNINTSLALDKTKTNSTSFRNLFNYLSLNRKFQQKRRQSNPAPSIIRNKYRFSKRAMSTGQLKEISL
jgi:hypothetical protein